jgi:hypothetical protein
MIKAELDLLEIEVEVLHRHTTIGIQPMFGIGPEALDAVDMIASPGHALDLADDHVLAPHRQRGVGMPVIGIIETARVGMSCQQRQQLLLAAGGDWEDQDPPIALVQPKNQHFTCGTPAPLARPMAPKQCLVRFDFTRQVLQFRERLRVDRLSDAPVDALAGQLTEWHDMPKSVGRHSQHEVAHQLIEMSAGAPQLLDPARSGGQAEGMPTGAAAPAVTAKQPASCLATFRALHVGPNYPAIPMPFQGSGVQVS